MEWKDIPGYEGLYRISNGGEVLNVNMDAKPVVQSTMGGKFVACWANIATAAKTIGVSAPCITDCCNGRARQAAGYVWSFAREEASDFMKGRDKQEILRIIFEIEDDIELLKASI